MNRFLSKFQSPKRKVGWLFLLFIFLGLSVRLFWTAAETETGFCTLRTQWRNATAGWIVGDRQPIYMQEPSEQADYWLLETDRVLKNHPNDARLAMGAALLLDAPNSQFEVRHSKAEKFMGAVIPEFDELFLRREEDAFEKKCRQRCLEFAAQATAMDSSYIDWWRLRALLLFRQSRHSTDDLPRSDDWFEILEECKRHDPENALYDYLEAAYFWSAGGLDMDFSDAKGKLIVKDAATVQKGRECFARGQAKPHCTVGNAGFTATADFLTCTDLPITEHQPVIDGRYVCLRRQSLLIYLWRRQGYQATDKADAGDILTSLAMKRQNLHLCDQFYAAGSFSAFDQVTILCRLATTERLKSIADEHKSLLSDSEIEKINDLRTSAFIEKMVIEKAAQSLPKNQKRSSTAGITALDNMTFISDILVSFAPSIIVLLLLVGAAALVSGHRFSDSDAPVVGPIGHIAALLAAAAISFVFFGLAPAEILSRKSQMWIFSIGLLLLPVVMVSWIGWLWLKKHAYQFTVRALLIGTVILYLVFGLISALSGLLTDFPFRLWIPPRNVDGLDAGFLEPAVQALGYGCWAVYQWRAYGGCYIALAIWVGLVAVGCTCKISCSQRQPTAIRVKWLSWLGGLFRSLIRPAFVLALMLLLAYLTITPSLLKRNDLEFQDKIAFARHPEKYWAEVAACVEAVRSNEAEMKAFQDAALGKNATEIESIGE